MKKKIGIILAILLCAVLVFTLVACGNNDNTPSEEEQPKETKPVEEKLTVTAEAKAEMELDIGNYIETWLKANAEEKDNITDQSKGLKAALTAKEFNFIFKRTSIEPTNIKVTFDKSTAKYDVTITYGSTKLSEAVVLSFKKDAETVTYAPWSGTKVQDEWLLSGKNDPGAYDVIDKLVGAGLAMINKVTGNSVTGKFGANGVVGIDIAGNRYGLKVKGNVDITKVVTGKDENEKDIYEYAHKADNEVGLVVVNGDDDEIFGIYYDAAATAKDSRIYIQYSTTGEDGKLVRDANNKVVSKYMYIEYADILGYIESLLPDTFSAANEGALSSITTKDENGVEHTYKLNGLKSILLANDLTDAEGIVAFVVGLIAKPYKDGDTYYVDINLGELLANATSIINELEIDKADAIKEQLNVDIYNLSGLLGHITLSGKIEDNLLTNFEFAVNIPECKFYLNGERSTENEKNPKELCLEIPAISFSIYLDDLSFFTDEAVQNVIPADAKTQATYFSPTNVDLSGDVYINHAEDGEDKLDKTFHFDFVTDVNPFEIVENLDESTAGAVLRIVQHAGKVAYTEANKDDWTNFLTVSYQQASKILTMSGTAFGLEDGGNTIYGARLGENILGDLMLWLGMDTESGNWNGLAIDDATGMIVILDYQPAYTPAKFVEEKNYYKLVEDEYVLAVAGEDYVIGDDVPADTYYVKTTPYKSAQIIFGDDTVKQIVSMILAFMNSSKEEPKESEVYAEAADFGDVSEYFDIFKELYEKYLKEKKINITTDPEFALSVDVSLDMIKEVAGALNSTLDLGIKLDDITDPEYVKIFANTGDYVGKTYITVKVKGDVYELTFDDSVAKTFKINFRLTRASGRTYAFGFEAVKNEDGTTWSATVVFDIQGEDDEEPINHTEVTLSAFHGTWGDATTERVGELIPAYDYETGAKIFPAEDVDSVGNVIASGIVKLLNNQTALSILFDAMGLFMA